MNTDFVYTSDQDAGNWFFNKYYFAGSNARYWTFQQALNILNQTVQKPVILETGCQRQADDLGAGMSTSIFAEYVQKYGGKLTTVDLIPMHLEVCKQCTSQFKDVIEYIESDSLIFLANHPGNIDLLYLDSVDYPVGNDEGNKLMQFASQSHCLKEFQAIEARLNPNCLLLIDDNQLPGGGKPRMLKAYLATKGWICLMDFQQSLWIKELKKAI